MVRITTVDLAEARNRLKARAPGWAYRAPYREAIANLSESRMLELELDAGESMRKLRLNIARAAKEVNRLVDYGVSTEGTLLVWLQDKPKQKRGPKKAKSTNGE
jgi:hypothetical protein